jgi:hypothetical protein
MQSATDSTPDAWLTVADLVARTGLPERTVKRRVAVWCARGWPRVRRAKPAGAARWCYQVHEGDFDRLCAGDGPAAHREAA